MERSNKNYRNFYNDRKNQGNWWEKSYFSGYVGIFRKFRFLNIAVLLIYKMADVKSV